MNDQRFQTRHSTRRTSPKLIRSGALAIATTLAVMVPSVAEAKSYVRADPKGDVVKFDNPNDDTATAVPDRAEGDILTSGVVHAKRRVRMAMRYDELTPSGDGSIHYFRIGTPRMIRFLFIEATPGHWRGVGSFVKGSNFKNVKCRGIGWSIDYDANLIRASVPRGCLGRPKWVHVGLAESTSENPAIFVDDAATNGYIGDNPKWGPRVFR